MELWRLGASKYFAIEEYWLGSRALILSDASRGLAFNSLIAWLISGLFLNVGEFLKISIALSVEIYSTLFTSGRLAKDSLMRKISSSEVVFLNETTISSLSWIEATA